ncbi:hypothetical protein BG844_11835 [Couchioplanes caeruleus subsp. caeruleus]|uniref:DUF3558 domain-containing protein n=1 Tax=Couchioplanes caeruleus subsp. caeruleus TaxID=56427 RepID=A0A1K0FMK7_9ACTN|nr:hypothetical protein BG844_11835 [Couchioplanes caeruleus subsp. caeruleus]
MKYGKLHAVTALAMASSVLTGCGGTDEPAPAAPADAAAVSVPSADSPAGQSTPTEDGAAEATAPAACSLLSIAEIKKLTGLVVSVRTNTPDRCIWVVEKPKDSHYGGLTIGVEGYASAEEAKEQFKWYVKEKVPGIGDEASISDSGVTSLAVLVGAAKITVTEQNPAITREVLLELGRSAARNAG